MKHNYYIFLILSMLYLSFSTLMAQPANGDIVGETVSMRGTYYSDRFVGRKTSSGEVFTQKKYTAAHNSFKFGTLLLVTNPKNGKQVIVRVNDRCPRRNVVDMTRTAAKQIGVGSLMVNVQILPDSYYPYWEAQTQILDVLEKGEFLAYAKTHKAPAVSDKIDDGEKFDNQKTKSNDKQQAKHETKATTDHQLYDIELCRCPSRNTAQKRVAQLPIYYQNYADYKTLGGADGVVVILTLSVKQPKAESVVDELKGLFPDAKIIKSQ